MYLPDHPGMPQGLDESERAAYQDACVLIEAAVIQSDTDRLAGAKAAAAKMEAAQAAREEAMAELASGGMSDRYATMAGGGKA